MCMASRSEKRVASGPNSDSSTSAAQLGRSRSCTTSLSSADGGLARFLDTLNYCMLLPGPEAQQLAIYVGWLLHKVKGGIAQGSCSWYLPSS
jgi:hypothetical protein